MAKCPKCSKEIKSLKNVCSGWQTSYVEIEKGRLKYYSEWNEWETDGNVYEFLCPFCLAYICGDENEAEEFLKSEVKDEQTKTA